MPEHSVRVAILDDHPVFRLGVRTALTGEPGIELVGEATLGAEVIPLLDRCQPDILLLDFQLPDMSGLEVLGEMRAANRDVRVVFVTAGMTDIEMRSALERGAMGVVLKHTASDTLPDCIRHVSKGGLWMEPDQLAMLLQNEAAPPLASPRQPDLLPRELAIVKLIARGATNKEVGARLDLNEQTVKNYLRRIFKKLKLESRVQLALYAVEHDLVDPDEARPSGS